MLFRGRERLVHQRTELVNALRSHLYEYGHAVPQGIGQIRPIEAIILASNSDLPKLVWEECLDLLKQIAEKTIRIDLKINNINILAAEGDIARRLPTMPGVGPLSALAIEAIASYMGRFRRGRDFSAWLGLVPRQHSSGGKERLAEILDQRVITDNQIATVRAALQEIEKDIVFARDLPEEILCPTCGTSHQNDFANRYSIIEDREACLELISEASTKIQQLAKLAASVVAEARDADAAMAEIQAALDARRNDVSLADVIEGKGRRIASDLFREKFDSLTDEISNLVNEIKEIEAQLSALKDRKRHDKIVAFYAQLMVAYLDRLDVSNYSVQEFTKLPARISETGSDCRARSSPTASRS